MKLALLLAVALSATAGCRRRAPSPEAADPVPAAAATPRVRVQVRDEEQRLLRSADRVQAFRLSRSVSDRAEASTAGTADRSHRLEKLAVIPGAASAELPAEVARKVAGLLLKDEAWPDRDPAFERPKPVVNPDFALWFDSPEGAVVVLWDSGTSGIQIRLAPEADDPEFVDADAEEFAASAEIRQILRECLPADPQTQDLPR